MVTATMYEIMEAIVGTPADDVQKEILYLGAVCISVIVVYFIIYLFKVISGIIAPDNRR